MHLVRVGDYTFNLDNITEIVDYGTVLAVCFSAAWPNPDPKSDGFDAHVLSRNLTGDDAEAMRRYIGRLADDARAQVR